MQAIQTQLQINRVSISKDDSISFSATTPALNDAELAAFRSMAKLLVNALFEPELGSSGVLKITEPLTGKTKSQKLKGWLYTLWIKEGQPLENFDLYYDQKMLKIIDWVRTKVEEYD